MIFKTLPSIISSINQLGEASNKLKAINFSMVGLNAGNLDAYRNAISGISKEQAALLLSTQGLNQAQIDLVLSNEKVTASEIAEATTLDGVVKKKSILTVEQQKQLISSQALTTEKLAEISATLGLETAENGSLISKKALNAEMVKQQLESIGVIGSTQAQIMNMLGLTTAETSAATASNVLSGAMAKLSLAMSTNPIGALITVIGIAVVSVYGLTKAFDALTDSAEEIDGRVDDLISKYNDLKTTADNNASTVESLADEYESLSKGVNDLGENVYLTSEEYARYNEIVNQIADMFPTLITGYTDEGTAILSLKGNVEQLRDAYKEAQQEAYNLLVATGKDSDGNDIMESYKNLSELDWWDSSIGAEDVTTTVKRDITKQILDLMSNMDTAVEEYDKLAQTIFDTYGDKGYNFLEEMGLPAIKDVFSDTSGITEEALIAGRATVQSYYQGFQSEIDTKLSKVKLMANAFLNTNDFYLDDSTNSELKNALSVMINSIDEELANSFNGEQVKVGAYVNNIVNSIKGNEEVQKELIDLFTIDTTDMPVSDIAEQINGYITSIAIAINEDPEELKIRLGFDYVDDLEAQYQRAVDFAKKKFDGYDPTAFFKEHSINTQEEIDKWQEIAQGAKDAAEAEKEYLNQGLKTEISLSLPDAQKLVNGLKDGETETLGLIDELSLLQEILSDTGNIQQETYAKLLSCSSKYSAAIRTENGRITLNTTKLKQVAKSRQLDTQETIKQTIALMKQNWLQWANNIDNYNGTLLESITSKYNDIDALQNEITQYELLANSVNEASNAFESFKTAQSTNDQDMYDTAQEMFNVLKGYSSDPNNENYGKYNRDEFQEAAINMMDTATYKKFINAKDLGEAEQVVKSFVKSVEPLFDEKNYNSAANLFDRIEEIINSGDIPKADKDWAKRLGIDEELFHGLSIFGNQYSFAQKEIFESYQLNTLDNYYEKLQAVKSAKDALNAIEDNESKEYFRQEAELNRLTESYNTFVNDTAQKVSQAFADFQQNPEGKSFADYLKKSFDFDDNDITGSLMAIIDKSGDLQKTLDSISLNEVVQSQQEEYQELQNLNQIISTLNENGYSSVDVEVKNKSNFNEVYSEYEKLKQKVLEYQEAISNSDNPHEINELNGYLSECVSNMDKLREPLRIEIEANIERVNSQLESVKSKINELNSQTSLSPYQQERLGVLQGEQAALESQQATLEAQLKIVVDSTDVDDYKPEDKEGTVSYSPDFSQVESAVPPTLNGTVKYTAVIDTSGLAGSLGGSPQTSSGTSSTSNTGASSNGGSHAKGTVGNAFANGYNGLPANEKNALRSEYGQKEMTVYPDGRYEITETPTLSDLPKGTVIFNEKQTNRILKGISHFKGTVGKAFAPGTGTKINLPNLVDVISNNNAVANKNNKDKSNNNNSSDSTSHAVQEAQEATEEFFDWIERRIKRFQALFDKWIKQAETAVTSGFINKYYKKATSAIKNELST